MVLYQKLMWVTITSNKNNTTPGKEYLVIGMIEEKQQFWFINDAQEFDLIPVASCKYLRIDKEYGQTIDDRGKYITPEPVGNENDNRKSDGTDGLLTTITRAPGRKK